MKKIIIITGASSGMGKEFALQIARDTDADELWLIARRRDKLKDVCAQIHASAKNTHVRKPLKAKPIALDICGRAGVAAFAELLKKENARGDFAIALLVNNAGFGTYGPFENTSVERELAMIELNCTSLTGLCGVALPPMKSGSAIINTASLAAFLPLGNFAVYGATKAYVLSFTMALAAEVKERGIHVCALCPGPVSTEFAHVASNGARREVRNGLDAGKVVAHCLRRVKNKKRTAIMAFKWKFKAFASRFIGRYAGARFTYIYCKRPYAP